MQDGRKIELPGKNVGGPFVMNITDDLPIYTFDQTIEGHSFSNTIIQQMTTGKDVIRNGALAANRLSISNVWLKTKAGVSRGVWAGATVYTVDDVVSVDANPAGVLADTRKPYVCLVAHTATTFAADLAASRWGRAPSAIYMPFAPAEAGIVYLAEFNRMRFDGLGDALHLGVAFNNSVRNSWASSVAGHSFYEQGGNTSTYDSTYALICGPDKAGYRSPGGATYISCNGINSLGSIFWFGGVPTDTHSAQTSSGIFSSLMLRCNAEKFTKYGYKLRGEGIIRIDGGAVGGVVGTNYIRHIDAAGSCSVIMQVRPKFFDDGTRVADASEGVSVAGLSALNIASANSKFLVEDGPVLLVTTAGINPKPAFMDQQALIAFTPTIEGSATPGAQPITGQTYYWLERGGVRVKGRTTLGTKDATMAGTLRLGNLPYTSNASIALGGAGVVSRYDLVTLGAGYTQLGVEVGASANFATFLKGGNSVAAGVVSAADVVTGSIFDYDFWYHI
jgi:hypothetical protein